MWPAHPMPVLRYGSIVATYVLQFALWTWLLTPKSPAMVDLHALHDRVWMAMGGLSGIVGVIAAGASDAFLGTRALATLAVCLWVAWLNLALLSPLAKAPVLAHVFLSTAWCGQCALLWYLGEAVHGC